MAVDKLQDLQDQRNKLEAEIKDLDKARKIGMQKIVQNGMI